MFLERYAGLRDGQGRQAVVRKRLSAQARDRDRDRAGVGEDAQRARSAGRGIAISIHAGAAWGALEELFPQTGQQRCWMHKTGNVLNYLPKSVQAKAKIDVA